MVWNAKLVFGLLNCYNLTSYQTNFTKPNILNQIYWLNQICTLKCKGPNKQNQIFSIKPPKLNQRNQFYQTKSRETKSKENQSMVQSNLSWACPSSAPACCICCCCICCSYCCCWSQKPTFVVVLLLFCWSCCFCCWSQKPTFKVWSKSGL